MKYIIAWACLFGASAVGLGAYGSHGLTQYASPELVARFNLGVEYQFYHAFALLACGLAWTKAQRALLGAAVALFSFGIFAFSGTLYHYAITGVKAFGPVTPIGGSAMILAWLLFGLAILIGDRQRANG
ncbi:DUF423 domain-containing protein [Paraferrimonas sedimenticola]|uniref:Membrane protein n=1 Tax=Paraferrimonas sedimenticola TaxID=375674 RepID=A0AA37RU97_9GAMM|nr:DUF423 domain-containing protein [Paraferrimonas sedimenticola]GLP95238.1 membrane protein [Paraferrimonas sedimenticola]